MFLYFLKQTAELAQNMGTVITVYLGRLEHLSTHLKVVGVLSLTAASAAVSPSPTVK